MPEVVVAGVGMHPFGRFPGLSPRELVAEAVRRALQDAGVELRSVQAAYVANSYAGLLDGQESVRGQVVLRYCGITGIPIVNVENACAGGATALHLAAISVAAGYYDVVLAVGFEKLFCGETGRSLAALSTSADVEVMRGTGFQFMAVYAMKAQAYMRKYGATARDLAEVVAKNSYHASQNQYAQFRKPLTVEQVLEARPIIGPLTLYMCSSMADGAAAAVVCSQEWARRSPPGIRRPWVIIAASVLRSGGIGDHASSETVRATARLAFEKSGVDPGDVGVAEVHDAAAPAEFDHMEDLGLCGPGDAYRMVRAGQTRIGGRLPVNPSGGLTSRGHPVAATGLAQVAEIVWQLRGEAGSRQVERKPGGGLPNIGVCLNTGGRIEDDRAATAVHVLKR